MIRHTLSLAMAVAALTAWSAPAYGQVLVDHSSFTAVLDRHLEGGLVDYAGLKEDRSQLDAYIAALGAAEMPDLAHASEASKLAFWINAYNACALRLVIDHYPIKKAGFPASLIRSLQGVPGNSIRQIPDTWSREFCPVAGKDRALDEIEHEIIRPMGDPRIHFAVNCASISCPVLAPEAYTAEALDEQLDAAVARLIADSTHYRLETDGSPVLRLNKVLDWYKDDFGGTQGVVKFLIPYVRTDEAAVLASGAVRVEHFDYDWTLNDVRRETGAVGGKW